MTYRNVDFILFNTMQKIRVIQRLAAAVVVLFLLAVTVLVMAGMNDRLADADVIVVPGNTIGPDGRPVPRLQARLDAALQLFRDRHAPVIFVSGGTGKEGFDEALSMSRYLIEKGVPASAIIVDSAGFDTEATARNAAAFMRTKDLRTALVATQYFHVPRMKLALERHHVQVIGNLHPHFFEVRDLYSTPREVVAYMAYMAKANE